MSQRRIALSSLLCGYTGLYAVIGVLPLPVISEFDQIQYFHLIVLILPIVSLFSLQ